MADARAAYAARDGTAHPKYFDDLFFWGTEQGLASAKPIYGPAFHAQIMTRQNLTMLGEGFACNQLFYFADFDYELSIGLFYNCTQMVGRLDTNKPYAVAPKQAASALAASSWLLKGYETDGRIPGICTGPADFFGYKYKDTEPGSSDIIYAIWKPNYMDTDNSTAPYTLDIGSGNYTVYDMGGDVVDSGSGSSVELTLSRWVQYVKVTN
jgi:hypothetical protein